MKDNKRPKGIRERVRAAAEELNLSIRAAHQQGLRVDLYLVQGTDRVKNYTQPVVQAIVRKVTE